MPQCPIDGEALYYLERGLARGAGEPLLLVHGLGSSGADWAFQVAALEADFRIIVPDLPGCGRSRPTANYAIGALAARLWALLDALGEPTVRLVGYSLGGAIALEMALARPGAVPALVLINSLASYRPGDPRKWLEARLTTALVRGLGLRAAGALVGRRLFPRPAQAAMRARVAEVFGTASLPVYLAMARALERWSALGRLGGLADTTRTLVVAAEHDYTPLPEKHALAAALGGELRVVRGSRHGTPYDSVGIVNAALRAHLSGEALPGDDRWCIDDAAATVRSVPPGSILDDHARGA